MEKTNSTNKYQVEQGNFTRIINIVIDELVKAPLLASELQICLFVIRRTWGFNKTSDKISLTQFEKALNKSRPTIVKALKNLQLVNILLLVKKGNSLLASNEWKINKYTNTWKLVKTPKLVKSKNTTSKIRFTKLVKTPLHTKDNIKDNITKENILSKDNMMKSHQTEKKSFGNLKVNLILDTYKKYFGFTPTDRKPRFVAQTMVKNIEAFIKEASPYKKYTFEEVVKKSFDWYDKRDQIKGETLDVVRRKVKKLFELTLNKLKGGEKK